MQDWKITHSEATLLDERHISDEGQKYPYIQAECAWH